MVKREEPIGGAYFHLSFDDGFKNNYNNALLILKQNNVPAIFFVPSGLIGAEYEQAVEYYLKNTNYKRVIEMMEW
jgi:peptidoglycan/xylan/chitin deacetylase (PgdA/CDA1 family)